MLAILADILKTKEDFYVYGNYGHSLGTFGHFLLWFRNKRLFLKIRARILIESPHDIKIKDSEYFKLTDIRYCSEIKNISSLIFSYGDKVAIVTQKEPIVGVLIKNKEISETYHSIFEHYWSLGHSSYKSNK